MVLIGIHCDKNVKSRDATIKEKKISYPVCQAVGEKSMRDYQINGFPTVFVINRKGIIVNVDPANLDKAVKAALKSK